MRQVWQERPLCGTVQINKLGPTVAVDEWSVTLLQDPLQPRIRVLSPTERAHLIAATRRWLAAGYVEPTKAWVVHNPVFVEKKDHTIRTCIDYRPINAAMKDDLWPLPRIQDIRHRLVGARWFAKVDLKDAFHRIRIPPSSRPATAFHTPMGNYQFTRMPFGLKTAPAVFQRFIEWSVRGQDCIAYVDDILVFGRDRAECARKERSLRRTLGANQITINELKSHGPVRQTNFVGMQLTKRGIGSALPLRQEFIPTNRKEWESFLGYANCYRDYIPRYAEKTAGLYPGSQELPREEREAKATELWAQLAKATSIHHYSDHQPGQLYLDASKYAVGAILTQKGKVCAIFSKGLTKAQQNYSTTDREHLALMLGLEAFRVFVQSNQKLEVNTDHTALLNRQEHRMTGRQLRWKTRILEITDHLAYVPGKDNPADYWSRQGWRGGGDNQYT